MAGIQHQAKRRQAAWLKKNLADESRCGKNCLTPAEKRDWAICVKAERRRLGLVDGLRFEDEESANAYFQRKEDEAAAHRPDRRREEKRRVSFERKVEFKERDADYEKQKQQVAAMSPAKASRMVEVMKAKYAGSVWPKDVCRLYGLLQRRGMTAAEAV